MKQMPFKPIVKKNYQQGTIGKELSAKIQLLVKRQDIIPEILKNMSNNLHNHSNKSVM